MGRGAATAVIFGTLVVAACQPHQQQSVTVTSPALSLAPGIEAPPPVTAIPDPVDAGGDEGEQVAAAAIPADIAATPAVLRGMESGVIRAAFGPPNFRRRDKSAEIWQYYGRDCILDLFLYREDGRQRVAHYHLRSRDASGAVEAGCYAGLVKAR